jgi:hypothetical protein
MEVLVKGRKIKYEIEVTALKTWIWKPWNGV